MIVVIRRSEVRRPRQIMWPRYLPDARTGRRRVVLSAIDPADIPPHWQQVGVVVPGRLATCAEVGCPRWEQGWTEVLPGDGQSHPRTGRVSEDEARATWGPTAQVIWHEPETPCGLIHKIPSGEPPIYLVNGRPVGWAQFEDALAGGVRQIQRLIERS